MVKGIRYFFSDDDRIGVTPSQLKRVGRARQLGYIKFWFNTYFEDPVQETPWVEGEYVYLWGGPYDADEVIQDKFGDLVSYERMREAIDEIESDGTTDWAPTSRHPDYQASLGDRDEDSEHDADVDEPSQATIEEILRRLRSGASIHLGGVEERFERQVLRDHVAKLEAALARMRSAPPGRGHNGPPDEDDDATSDLKPSLADAVADVATIKREIELSTPDVLKVAEATSRLSRFGKWIAARAQKALERAVENAISWAPGVVLTKAAEHGMPLVVPLIEHVESTVVRWAEIAVRMF